MKLKRYICFVLCIVMLMPMAFLPVSAYYLFQVREPWRL